MTRTETYTVFRTGTLITGHPELGVALVVPWEESPWVCHKRFVSEGSASEFGRAWADEVNGTFEEALRSMDSHVRGRRAVAS